MAKRRKKKSASPHIDATAVVQLFRDKRKPLALHEILRGLNAPKVERQHLLHILDSLVEAGKLIRVKHGWGLTESMNLITGRLEIQRSGVGFVIPEDKRRKDVFISPRDFNGAWHGDKVVAAVTRERKGRHHEGRVARIIERGSGSFTVRVEKLLGRNYFLCQPTDPRQPLSIMLETDEALTPETVLLVRPVEPIDRELWSGEIMQVLGPESDVAVQERLVKLNHSIPTAFPEPVLAEAANLPDVPGEDDFAGRRDLRETAFVTIDGAKARDFDDAVHVRREGKDYRLWVAIADVAHYVQPGSALDVEALDRANSYYFPQSVEPMFPEALSNGLCSLNPGVPRLAMVAEILFDPQGEPKEYDFYAAVIQSHARLTYAQVNRALFLDDAEEQRVLEPVMADLRLAEELARALNERRRRNGSLDFDLPEPEILFNIYGETMDIRPKVRHFGHQIIEEFMVSANEAVAEFLTDRGANLLYRVHPAPDPDKVRNLFKVLARTELAEHVPDEVSPKALQQVLNAAEGSDVEFMVSRLTLRTMMQAKYSPVNEGHFGLASECYCHFTSPIRRYADLVVHRALKGVLGVPGGRMLGVKKLKDEGEHLSRRERTGMEAEREILKRLTVLLLRDKVGQEFTGVINGLADFGFWVELHEVMAEGLVRLSTLDDDYYTLFSERQMLVGERTGRRLSLGQKVHVMVEDVSLGRQEITLTLLPEPKPEPEPAVEVAAEAAVEVLAEVMAEPEPEPAPAPAKAPRRGPDRGDPGSRKPARSRAKSAEKGTGKAPAQVTQAKQAKAKQVEKTEPTEAKPAKKTGKAKAAAEPKAKTSATRKAKAPTKEKSKAKPKAETTTKAKPAKPKKSGRASTTSKDSGSGDSNT